MSNERIKRMGKTLDVLENLNEIKKQEKKNLDLELKLARAKVKRLRSQNKNTIRSKYGLVPRGTKDHETGKELEEV
jgi:hypothetical protein